MKQRGNPIVTLRFPETTLEALKSFAEEEHTTVSEIIRAAVLAALEKRMKGDA